VATYVTYKVFAVILSVESDEQNHTPVRFLFPPDTSNR
jgi:hypothetical protein